MPYPSPDPMLPSDGSAPSLKHSLWRVPGMVMMAITVVSGFNLALRGNSGWSIGPLRSDLFSAFCFFGCLSFAMGPVWYASARRLVRHGGGMAPVRQLLTFLGLLLVALLVSPRFGLQVHDYDTWSESDRRDITLTWMKRSLIETLVAPQVKVDELTWLQSNYSVAYIPAQVYCPRRSTRLYPLFGTVRDDYLANALASGLEKKDPPAAAVANGIARCQREGPAMRVAGFTKEGALMQGDVDRFLHLNALEETPDKGLILEDAEIPPDVMAKIEATLKLNGAPLQDYLDEATYFRVEYFHGQLEDGQVRRLRPLVVAAALGRLDEARRLRRPD